MGWFKDFITKPQLTLTVVKGSPEEIAQLNLLRQNRTDKEIEWQTLPTKSKGER